MKFIDLNSITRHLLQIVEGTEKEKQEIIRLKEQICEKQPFPVLLQLIEHSDINIVSDTICSIYNLLRSQTNTTQSNSQHPQFEIISSAGGIEKLYKLFSRNDQDKNVKDKAALCIEKNQDKDTEDEEDQKEYEEDEDEVKKILNQTD
ncbi:MAG: hypothetical protein EZS28_021565 [Streblomastix strix]|uniref:Uncharacterized protein n=1 Tax=Streblomastix strix TaxID=222440 RepID=A0A5J4VJY3_9EUKA|nr:MAG: hypothetical protein EZS28_021565 [Streblomastix strix]